jgi:hypothetical protein
MLESLFKPFLYLMRYQRELRLREECRFIGSEAFVWETTASADRSLDKVPDWHYTRLTLDDMNA